MKHITIRCFRARCQKRILDHEPRDFRGGLFFCAQSEVKGKTCGDLWQAEAAGQVQLTRHEFQEAHPAPRTVSEAFALLRKWNTPVHGVD